MDKNLENYLQKLTMIPDPPKTGPSIKPLTSEEITKFILSLSKDENKIHPGYKEVKNLVHNEMGLTRENIADLLAFVAKEELGRVLGEDREFIKSQIRTSVKEVIRAEMISVLEYEKYPKVIGHTWHYPYHADKGLDFKNYVLHVMKTEIMDQLSEGFDINLDFNPKQKPNPKSSNEEIGFITVTVKTSSGNIYVVDDETLLNLAHLQVAVEHGRLDRNKIHIVTNKTHHLINKEELDELLLVARKKWSKEKALWVEAERVRLGVDPIRFKSTDS